MDESVKETNGGRDAETIAATAKEMTQPAL